MAKSSGITPIGRPSRQARERAGFDASHHALKISSIHPAYAIITGNSNLFRNFFM
jgi:hypothetical protein